MFAFDPALDEHLTESSVLARSLSDLRAEWEEATVERVGELDVDVSVTEATALLDGAPEYNGRDGEHTDALAELVEDTTPTEVERI